MWEKYVSLLCFLLRTAAWEIHGACVCVCVCRCCYEITSLLPRARFHASRHFLLHSRKQEEHPYPAGGRRLKVRGRICVPVCPCRCRLPDRTGRTARTFLSGSQRRQLDGRPGESLYHLFLFILFL